MTTVTHNHLMPDGVLDIQWAKKGERIRRVVKRSNHRITGKLPSWKMGRMLHWESKLERDALYLHEADPTVRLIREQPVRLRFRLNGELRTHVPDLYVKEIDKRIFREVKSVEEAESPEVRERTEHLSKILQIYGFYYDVITEGEIRVETRLKNAKWLTRLGQKPVNLNDVELIRRKFSERGFLLWGDVKADCLGEFSAPKVCRLILEGLLSLDIDRKITDESKVCLGQPKKKENYDG